MGRPRDKAKFGYVRPRSLGPDADFARQPKKKVVRRGNDHGKTKTTDGK